MTISLNNLDSLVDYAVANFSESDLRNAIVKETTLCDRFIFHIFHWFTSIDERIGSAITIAKAAKEGQRAISKYHGVFKNRSPDHKFEAYLMNVCGSNPSNTQIGKCWIEVTKQRHLIYQGELSKPLPQNYTSPRQSPRQRLVSPTAINPAAGLRQPPSSASPTYTPSSRVPKLGSSPPRDPSYLTTSSDDSDEEDAYFPPSRPQTPQPSQTIPPKSARVDLSNELSRLAEEPNFDPTRFRETYPKIWEFYFQDTPEEDQVNLFTKIFKETNIELRSKALESRLIINRLFKNGLTKTEIKALILEAEYQVTESDNRLKPIENDTDSEKAVTRTNLALKMIEARMSLILNAKDEMAKIFGPLNDNIEMAKSIQEALESEEDPSVEMLAEIYQLSIKIDNFSGKREYITNPLLTAHLSPFGSCISDQEIQSLARKYIQKRFEEEVSKNRPKNWTPFNYDNNTEDWDQNSYRPLLSDLHRTPNLRIGSKILKNTDNKRSKLLVQLRDIWKTNDNYYKFSQVLLSTKHSTDDIRLIAAEFTNDRLESTPILKSLSKEIVGKEIIIKASTIYQLQFCDLLGRPYAKSIIEITHRYKPQNEQWLQSNPEITLIKRLHTVDPEAARSLSTVPPTYATPVPAQFSTPQPSSFTNRTIASLPKPKPSSLPSKRAIELEKIQSLPIYQKLRNEVRLSDYLILELFSSVKKHREKESPNSDLNEVANWIDTYYNRFSNVFGSLSDPATRDNIRVIVNYIKNPNPKDPDLEDKALELASKVCENPELISSQIPHYYLLLTEEMEECLKTGILSEFRNRWIQNQFESIANSSGSSGWEMSPIQDSSSLHDDDRPFSLTIGFQSFVTRDATFEKALREFSPNDFDFTRKLTSNQYATEGSDLYSGKWPFAKVVDCSFKTQTVNRTLEKTTENGKTIYIVTSEFQLDLLNTEDGNSRLQKHVFVEYRYKRDDQNQWSVSKSWSPIDLHTQNELAASVPLPGDDETEAEVAGNLSLQFTQESTTAAQSPTALLTVTAAPAVIT